MAMASGVSHTPELGPSHSAPQVRGPSSLVKLMMAVLKGKERRSSMKHPTLFEFATSSQFNTPEPVNIISSTHTGTGERPSSLPWPNLERGAMSPLQSSAAAAAFRAVPQVPPSSGNFCKTPETW